MADVHEPEVRSYNMSRIRGKDTKPELLVRRFLHSHGFRYRLHDKKLPGKPDIVLQKYKTIIFVHGCFWHKCPLCKPPEPKSNSEFWTNKFERNIERDKNRIDQLKAIEWESIVIWKCQIKDDVKNCVERTSKVLINK